MDKYEVYVKKVSETGVNTTIETFVASGEDCYRIYESIWRNMDRENNLINQRISWAILFTSGILAAETFLLGRVMETLGSEQPISLAGRVFMTFSFGLSALLSLCAAVFCYRTKAGVDAAQQQVDYLKTRYERLESDGKRLFQDVMKLPRPYGNPTDHRSGNYAAKTFPLAMVFVWSLFVVIELCGTYVVGFVLDYDGHAAVESPNQAVSPR